MSIDTTQLLNRISEGNKSDLDLLFEHVYAELSALAASKLKAERPGHTLQPTALVNELYLKMVDQTRVNWRDRSHFMSIAATVMRRLLIDYARTRASAKRGGGRKAIQLDELLCLDEGTDPAEVVALSDCLEKLASLNERHCRVVELKVFGGRQRRQ